MWAGNMVSVDTNIVKPQSDSREVDRSVSSTLGSVENKGPRLFKLSEGRAISFWKSAAQKFHPRRLLQAHVDVCLLVWWDLDLSTSATLHKSIAHR